MRKLYGIQLGIVFGSVAGLVFGSDSRGHTQAYTPGLYQVPVYRAMYDRQFMTNTAINGMMRSQMLRDSARGGKGGTAKGGTSTAKKDPLQFTPTGVPILSDTDLARMTKSEAEKKALEAYLNNCLSAYAKVARNDGFPPNDIAYAFNFFVVNNYNAYKHVLRDYKGYKNRGVIDLSKLPDYVGTDKEKVIYAQFRRLLIAQPSITQMKDAEKEKLTAGLALATNIPWQMYDAAVTAGDDAAIERARQMAKQNLERLFDTSVDNIVIDENGVRLQR